MSLRLEYPDVSCVIVHHRRFPAVLSTIAAIRDSGVDRRRIVVVDNSDDAGVLQKLTDKLGDTVDVISVRNAGYAHAVNSGLAHLKREDRLGDFTVVSTHEALPQRDAVTHLRQALLSSPKAGVVGPTLEDASRSGGIVWSLGGRLSGLLNHPQHIGWGERVDKVDRSGGPVARDWLDGAFCMYRVAALERVPLREHYFLYFEETDCHTRMRKMGYVVAWVPSARVTQTSDGIPPYYLGRNLTIFQAAHGGILPRYLAVPVSALKLLARVCLGRVKPSTLAEFFKGWRDGHGMVSYLRRITSAEESV